MKRWIGLLSVLLACVFISAGCGSEKVNVKGTFVPLDSEADPNSEYFEGGTYTNEYFGWLVNLPKDTWRITNPKSLEHLEHVALNAYSLMGVLHIQIFNTEESSVFLEKTAIEFAEEHIRKTYEALIEKAYAQYVDEYYEIELELLNEKGVAVAMNTEILADGVRNGVFAYLPLMKDKYMVGISVQIDGATSADDVQKFLNDMFAALPE